MLFHVLLYLEVHKNKLSGQDQIHTAWCFNFLSLFVISISFYSFFLFLTLMTQNGNSSPEMQRSTVIISTGSRESLERTLYLYFQF